MKKVLDDFNQKCFQISAEIELMNKKAQQYQTKTQELNSQTQIIKSQNQTLQQSIQQLQKYIQRLKQDQPQIELINFENFEYKDENQIMKEFQLNLPNLDKAQQYLDKITKQNIEDVWKKQLIHQEKKTNLMETKEKYQKKLEKLDQKYYEQVQKHQEIKKKNSKK